MLEELTSEQLKKKLDENKPLFILDVRNYENFSNSHIEGKENATVVNAPFSQIQEKGGIQAYAKDNKLPLDQAIIVVCNRGRSSVVVASGLKEIGYHTASLIGGMSEWQDYHEINKVISDEKLSIFQISRVAKGCLSYLISINGKAIIIDPTRFILLYETLLKDLSLMPLLILDTHAHADHLSGGKQLADKLAIPYHLHPYDGIHPLDFLPANFSYNPLWENWRFSCGESILRALHIPGHTLGNQAFLLNETYLFSGDSIFINSIARPDLGGKAETWSYLHYNSLKKLMQLKDETVVFPGHFSHLSEKNEHGFSRKLSELKQSNEGLMMAQKPFDEFKQYILKNLPNTPNQYVDIKRANLGLLNLSEESLRELETGKNICALKF